MTAHRDVVVPYLGEGIRQVRVLRLLKQPGDLVAEDELLYEVESDKASLQIESPCTGRLLAWSVEPDMTLEVGMPVARVEVAMGPRVEPAAPVPSGLDLDRLPPVPPRTLSYGARKGLSRENLERILPAGRVLLPADVDRYLAGEDMPGAEPEPPRPAAAAWSDVPLPERQRSLNRAFRASQAVVVPATLMSVLPLGALARAGNALLAGAGLGPGERFVSEFQVFAFCVARAAGRFPKVRSVLIDDGTRREHADLHLGIAVHGEGGDLAVALIERAGSLGFGAFLAEMERRIERARSGEDQAAASMQLVLSNMAGTGVVAGCPLLVAPATGVIAFGTPWTQDGRRVAQLSFTFDHRLLNGIEAARFLQAIAEEVTALVGAEPAQTRPPEPAPVRGGASSLRDLILSRVGALLGVPPESLDPELSLGLQGVDSLAAVALKNDLEARFGEILPETFLWHYPTIGAMAAFFAGRTARDPEADFRQDPREALLREIGASLAGVPEGELERILAEVRRGA